MKNFNTNRNHFNFSSISILCILFLGFITLTSSSCGKDELEPDLVPITMTGENTMGFYVDGVPFNKNGPYGGFSPKGVSGGMGIGNVLRIFGAGGEPNNSITIYLPIDSINPLKEYDLNKSIYHFHQVIFIDNAPLGGNQYKTDSSDTGKFKLLRLDSKIASGTFYFDAVNPESGKVIQITDGRFDIKFF